MKNIHVLPTDNPSRLHYYSNVTYGVSKEHLNWKQGRHIYITSDEEIKEGNWVYNSLIVTFAPQIYQMPNHPIKGEWWDEEELSTTTKIILSTDPQLIEDGIQAIDDEFLQWFVKNPSCENVEVEVDLSKHNGQFQTKYGWKIIIPQEEPKQETIEEAAELSYLETKYRTPFIAGAKCMEKKMLELMDSYADDVMGGCTLRANEWFEQFKQQEQ
jgi:phage gp46-like protein